MLFNDISAYNLGEVYKSFDIVGDIAIIRHPYGSPVNAQTVANAIMNQHRNVKSVLLQTSAVKGDLRLRCLRCVAGENRTNTLHKEFGCLFAVDAEKCYFSPRLSYERMRIAKMVLTKETIINMFAGVGCFSIVIAKHAKPEKVFSIDINPAAYQFQLENIRLNRVYDKITPLLGDSKKIIINRLQHVADRVLMPLPEKAFEYLPLAFLALKLSGGWIHQYSFEHAKKNESPTKKIKVKVEKALKALGATFEVPFIRVIRSTGPNWYQLVADVRVTRKEHE
jgi:tRNA (guanine37-N1)-methyltransferase